MANKTLRHRDLEPGHPGDLLAEIVIPATGKTKVEIAKRLGISRQSLYDILGREQSITPAIAVRLGKLFGNGPEIWLRMQQTYDLWHAERELTTDLEKIETLDIAIRLSFAAVRTSRCSPWPI